jgi:sugar phosphate isomerase/epimerase
MDAFGLLALAARKELSGIETPLASMLPDLSTETIDQFRTALEKAGLALVVDTGVVDVDSLRTLLPLAERAGAKTVRATVSAILEGARTTLPGGWEDHLREIRRRVVELRPLLEAYDLMLALENHQDTTSDELIELCEAGGPRVGVTLDVVNPLAVGEEPLAFARKVGPLIRNVHLKDYRIYPTPSGYRLVRCALGDGVAPFPELLEVLREVAPEPTMHIELAALYARHIRLLEDDWWDGFPPRDVRDALPALRVAARHARPADEPWQTPWEAGAPAEEMARYERDQFERSVEYLRTVGA